MSFKPEDLIAFIPSVFSGLKYVASAISPRVAATVDFAEEITAFVVAAERDGLSTEAVIQGLGDLHVDLVQKLKTGVE